MHYTGYEQHISIIYSPTPFTSFFSFLLLQNRKITTTTTGHSHYHPLLSGCLNTKPFNLESRQHIRIISYNHNNISFIIIEIIMKIPLNFFSLVCFYIVYVTESVCTWRERMNGRYIFLLLSVIALWMGGGHNFFEIYFYEWKQKMKNYKHRFTHL